MPMTMSGAIELSAPREIVWNKLNDPSTLKSCIPGCGELNLLSDHEFEVIAVNRIGPVKAKFKGRVTLSDISPLEGYRISGTGDGGIAGFAKGAASVRLADNGDKTLLSYEVETQVGGKMAQLGQRLIDGAAKKLADQFFEKFADAVKEPA
jgi:carbon monoxide dehydrogenase subunit G